MSSAIFTYCLLKLPFWSTLTALLFHPLYIQLSCHTQEVCQNVSFFVAFLLLHVYSFPSDGWGAILQNEIIPWARSGQTFATIAFQLKLVTSIVFKTTVKSAISNLEYTSISLDAFVVIHHASDITTTVQDPFLIFLTAARKSTKVAIFVGDALRKCLELHHLATYVVVVVVVVISLSPSILVLLQRYANPSHPFGSLAAEEGADYLLTKKYESSYEVDYQFMFFWDKYTTTTFWGCQIRTLLIERW